MYISFNLAVGSTIVINQSAVTGIFLSADTRIPVTADWLITMVEPTAKLKEMYIEDVVNGPLGKNNSSNNKSDSDK